MSNEITLQTSFKPLEDELYKEYVAAYANKDLSLYNLLKAGFDFDEYRNMHNYEFIKRLLIDEVCSFTEILEAFSQSSESYMLYALDEGKLSMDLHKSKAISDDEFKLFFQSTPSQHISKVLHCTELFQYAFNNKLFDISEFIDILKQTDSLATAVDFYNAHSLLRIFQLQNKSFRQSQADFRLLFENLSSSKELKSLARNTELSLCFLTSRTCTFKEFVDKLSSGNRLHTFFNNTSLCSKLIDDEMLTKDSLMHLCRQLKSQDDFMTLWFNTKFALQILSNEIMTVNDFYNYFNKQDLTRAFFHASTELFDEALHNEWLTESDIDHILSNMKSHLELVAFCMSQKGLLKNALYNFKFVDLSCFPHLVFDSASKNRTTQILSEALELYGQSHLYDEQCIKSLRLNAFIREAPYDDEQKDRLVQILKQNEIAQNTLYHIIMNNLESNFTYENLVQHLMKNERKNVLNI